MIKKKNDKKMNPGKKLDKNDFTLFDDIPVYDIWSLVCLSYEIAKRITLETSVFPQFKS